MSESLKVKPLYMATDWFAGLIHEVSQSSKTAVAAKMGIHRTTLSQVCHGSGEYGKGTASVGKIEIAYRRAYEQLACPHTLQSVGIEHCRVVALSAAPTHNPLKMQQWRSCQGCAHKPDVMAVKEVKLVKVATHQVDETTAGVRVYTLLDERIEEVI
ncbi:MAG: MarR family transcriptional regulator [Undibacterium sp.]|nr:MarR family transcriptional regulator [Undibacterium sp.]